MRVSGILYTSTQTIPLIHITYKLKKATELMEKKLKAAKNNYTF